MSPLLVPWKHFIWIIVVKLHLNLPFKNGQYFFYFILLFYFMQIRGLVEVSIYHDKKKLH